MGYASCDGEAQARRFGAVVGALGILNSINIEESRLGVKPALFRACPSLYLETLQQHHQSLAFLRVAGISISAVREDLKRFGRRGAVYGRNGVVRTTD